MWCLLTKLDSTTANNNFNPVTKYRRCNTPFSDEVKTSIKNLHQFRDYGSRTILREYWWKYLEKNLKRQGNRKHRSKARERLTEASAYTGWAKKTAPNFSCNNFGKYGPILIMFSLLHSQMN